MLPAFIRISPSEAYSSYLFIERFKNMFLAYINKHGLVPKQKNVSSNLGSGELANRKQLPKGLKENEFIKS